MAARGATESNGSDDEARIEQLEAELMRKDQEITTLRFKLNAMPEEVRFLSLWCNKEVLLPTMASRKIVESTLFLLLLDGFRRTHASSRPARNCTVSCVFFQVANLKSSAFAWYLSFSVLLLVSCLTLLFSASPSASLCRSTSSLSHFV